MTETQRVAPVGPGLRYTVVKTYAVDALKPDPTVPALLPAIPQQPMCTDDAQFFSTNTKKVLTEIEAVSESDKTGQSTLPEKRSLDFISMPAKVEKTGQKILANKEAADIVTSTSEPVESLVKKGKGELRLN